MSYNRPRLRRRSIDGFTQLDTRSDIRKDLRWRRSHIKSRLEVGNLKYSSVSNRGLQPVLLPTLARFVRRVRKRLDEDHTGVRTDGLRNGHGKGLHQLLGHHGRRVLNDHYLWLHLNDSAKDQVRMLLRGQDHRTWLRSSAWTPIGCMYIFRKPAVWQG
jgi:hypothetical protein